MLNVCVYVPLVTPPGKPVNVGVVVATPVLPGAAVKQWMCAAVFGVVSPVNVTVTVIVFAVVSQITTPVPLPLDCGCGGFSFCGLIPGTTGPFASNSSTGLPVSATLAVAAAFLPSTLDRHPLALGEQVGNADWRDGDRSGCASRRDLVLFYRSGATHA